ASSRRRHRRTDPDRLQPPWLSAHHERAREWLQMGFRDRHGGPAVNGFSHLVYELEDYARQNGGRFWLLHVKSRLREPPNGSLYVVVDFEHGSLQASVFVDIVCKRHRYPYRT